MKERPILMTGEMVRSTISGIKTQTRRVLKIQHRERCSLRRDYTAEYWQGDLIKPPHGVPGDLLYVRETFFKVPQEYQDYPDADQIFYRATDERLINKDISGRRRWKWKPSLFMPKENARIWLRIKGLSIEPIQDITENNAKNEGVYPLISQSIYNGKPVFRNYTHSDALYHTNALDSFRSLWNSINEKRGYGWDKNPWVWVYEFEVLSVTGKKNVQAKINALDACTND